MFKIKSFIVSIILVSFFFEPIFPLSALSASSCCQTDMISIERFVQRLQKKGLSSDKIISRIEELLEEHALYDEQHALHIKKLQTIMITVLILVSTVAVVYSIYNYQRAKNREQQLEHLNRLNLQHVQEIMEAQNNLEEVRRNHQHEVYEHQRLLGQNRYQHDQAVMEAEQRQLEAVRLIGELRGLLFQSQNDHTQAQHQLDLQGGQLVQERRRIEQLRNERDQAQHQVEVAAELTRRSVREMELLRNQQL